MTNKCACPWTAPACVKRIYTNIALIDVTLDGLVLREVAPGLTSSTVEKTTAAPLKVADDCRQMDVPPSFNGVALLQ